MSKDKYGGETVIANYIPKSGKPRVYGGAKSSTKAYKGKHYFGQEEPTQKVKEEDMSLWPIHVPQLPLTFSIIDFNDRD